MPSKQEKQEKESKDAPIQVLATASTPPWRLIIIGVTVTIVFIILVAGGLMLLGAQRQQKLINAGFNGSQYMGPFQRGSGPFRRRGGGFQQAAAAQGVITAIDNDTIMVSGQGKQVTVKRTDSTTISGDKTDVAVNDTVVVVGDTGNDGTVTATRIIVRNQATAFGVSSDNTDDSSAPSDAPPGA